MNAIERLTANQMRVLDLFRRGYRTTISIRDRGRVEMAHPTLPKVAVSSETVRSLAHRHLIGHRSDKVLTRLVDFFATDGA